MAVHVLIAFAAAAVWTGSLLVRPFGRCPSCRGRRVTGKGRRCRLCRGKGRRQRLGSRAVHRIRRQVAAHWRGPR